MAQTEHDDQRHTDSDDSGGQKKRGRPPWRLQIDATPEELAQAIFATAKPPDPSRRVQNREDDGQEQTA